MADAVLIVAAGDPSSAPAGPLARGIVAADPAVMVEAVEPPGAKLPAAGPVAAASRAVAARSRARHIPALVTLNGARVVVSDEPATILALGRLRGSGMLAVPAVALVTREADPASQSAPGIDLQLLVDPAMRATVRETAPDSRIVCVRGLLDPRYEADFEVAASRRAIGVPEGCPLVVIWGGQDARGDLLGAGEVSLGADPASRVVILCGSNSERLTELQEAFGRSRRLRAVGPTDRLPELLAAADVLVETGGGLTSLEARLRGAAVLAHGSGRLADRQALANALIAVLREPRTAIGGYADRPAAADEVLSAAGLLPAPA